jgi:mannose-6-phosphate isomerase
MLYPIKFLPVFKDYIWGGRELEKLGKTLPEGITAESWEISTHPDGISSVSNGEFKGMLLTELVDRLGDKIVGAQLNGDCRRFPLLIKFIDANDRLSVQVHPEDEYAMEHENGEYGKNEMWYIISSKPGAKLIYGTRPGIRKEDFEKAVEEDRIGQCLHEVEVFPGDVLNIPAGLIHAIGDGIVLAEIQQNSNTTYRVFDYNRVDSKGNRRPLHIEKALDVIDFNLHADKAKASGLEVKLGPGSAKTYKIVNKYFSVEIYDVKDSIEEAADGSRFYIYVFVDGNGEIHYDGGKIDAAKGESILIPASLGKYTIKGNFKALKTYVPNIEEDVIRPLMKAGYSREEILENISGLK